MTMNKTTILQDLLLELASDASEAELGAEHISTVLVHGGAQVLHVFVRKAPHIRVRGRLTS